MTRIILNAVLSLGLLQLEGSARDGLPPFPWNGGKDLPVSQATDACRILLPKCFGWLFNIRDVGSAPKIKLNAKRWSVRFDLGKLREDFGYLLAYLRATQLHPNTEESYEETGKTMLTLLSDDPELIKSQILASEFLSESFNGQVTQLELALQAFLACINLHLMGPESPIKIVAGPGPCVAG
ncbi:MAG: hypothetical protein LBJ77_03190 [Holosporales bacterium]|jgi:hypothetical protein|nr:hypothetical protein [Holosporales bacterium]